MLTTLAHKDGRYAQNANFDYLLVFRRKDLCEAKHDLGVRKMCSKSTLYPLCYAFGGGGVKRSVLNMF